MFRRNFAQKSPRKILPKPAAEQDPPPGPSTTSSTTLEPTGALLAHSAPPQQSPEEGPESQPEEAENNLISSPASQSLKGKSPEALHQSIETSNAPDSDQNIDPTLDSLRSSARPLIRSMSQRSRPRSGPVKDEADTHEETAMWNQISKDLGKLSVIQKRQIEVTEQIKKKEVENKELDEAKSTSIFSTRFLYAPGGLQCSVKSQYGYLSYTVPFHSRIFHLCHSWNTIRTTF